MSTTPAEKRLPGGRGQRRFAALGYVLRVVKALPRPLRERVLDGAVSGVSSSLPPFPDVLRLVEAAQGVPDGTRWQERLLAHRPDLQAVRIRDIGDGGAGRLRARLYLPPGQVPAVDAALVWVHGGAFVIGSLEQKEAHWPAIELAASGIAVLSVDYRICIDDVHYPQPQDDVLTAWRWAVAHADQLGVPASRLHLGGGSAGGYLVAGATLRLRDAGEVMPASLFLGYPVLQEHLPPASPHVSAELAGVDLVSEQWLKDMFANWAGSTPKDTPYVSPGLADPSGLPPTYVLTCGHDILRRASEPYAQRLQEAGVKVRHDVFATAEHAPLDRPGTPDGEQAIEQLRSWLISGAKDMSR